MRRCGARPRSRATPPRHRQDALHGLLGVCCEVYNAALAERRDAWRSAGVKVSLFERFGQLTELRGLRDDVFAWGVQPLRGALRRLDEAYGAFLRRCAAGQTPGLPRFRSRRRFDTACWDEPSSWRVDLDARTLSIQGVGDIRLAKSAAAAGPADLPRGDANEADRHLSRLLRRVAAGEEIVICRSGLPIIRLVPFE